MTPPGVMHRFTMAAGFEWNSAWCWVPGPRRLVPVYAPALVAWVGGPAGGVSVAFGANVGWFPLAPREVYVPGYRVSPTYVRNVNITNTTIVNNTNITNVYQNSVTNIHYVNNKPAAVTAVPQNVFTSGQRVGGHAVRLPPAVLAGAPVAAAPPALVPTHQSVLGAECGPCCRSAARGAGEPPGSGAHPAAARTGSIRKTGAGDPAKRRPADSPRAELARLQPATPVAPVRLIAAGGAAVGAGAPAHGAGAARPGNPATPQRPGAAAPPASAGAQAPNLADRERVLQNSRVTVDAARLRQTAGCGRWRFLHYTDQAIAGTRAAIAYRSAADSSAASAADTAAWVFVRRSDPRLRPPAGRTGQAPAARRGCAGQPGQP